MLIVAGNNGRYSALRHQHEAQKLSAGQQGDAGVSYSVQTGNY
ncbi:MAG: hypothetical protein AAF773_22330 [Cyanobacteria bacterium P01_D01_bin.115]